MAKICIVEDKVSDLLRRYRFLANIEHEKYVVFWGMLSQEELTDINQEIHPIEITHDLSALPEADIYFMDGLERNCYRLAKRVGKNKTYIYSGSKVILDEANKAGYRIISIQDQLEEVVAKLS